ncbi:hypothetical protein AAFF_G00334850, partial [Aldrovandia affinis]
SGGTSLLFSLARAVLKTWRSTTRHNNTGKHHLTTLPPHMAITQKMYCCTNVKLCLRPELALVCWCPFQSRLLSCGS